MIVAAEDSFHGRTMGALALTGKARIRAAVRPVRGRRPVRALRRRRPRWPRRSAPDCAAVFLEPCLGEGGVVPGAAGLPARRPGRPATSRGAAGARRDPERHRPDRRVVRAPGARASCPDVLTLAKGLGGGLPIGACIGIGAVRRRRSARATTAARSAATRSPARRRSPCWTRSSATACSPTSPRSARSWPRGIEAIEHPLVTGVRGSGLWLALALAGRRRPRWRPRRGEAGFLVNAVQPDAVRLAPPLILTAAEADVVHRGAARHPRRGQRAGRPGGVMTAVPRRPAVAALPARRRPVARRAGRGAGARRRLKRDRPGTQPLAGPRAVAVLFDKPSLRTRVSFAVGIAELGGYPLVIDAQGTHAGRGESHRGHGQGAGPAGRGDRLADLRPGPDRGAWPRSARCRSSTR